MSQTIPLDGVINSNHDNNNHDNNNHDNSKSNRINTNPNINSRADSNIGSNSPNIPVASTPKVKDIENNTDIAMSLHELVNSCGQDAGWVMELMEENIIEYDIADTEQFSGYQLATVRRASRISRDFDASVPAIGLIIDLIDELEQLRQFKRQFENQCQVQDQVIEIE